MAQKKRKKAKKSSLPKLIGVIHLGALPGAPRAAGKNPKEVLNEVGEKAIREARALKRAGFDALIIENFGDAPFYKDSVPPETVSALAILATAIREAVDLPIGVNVLRNDAFSALAIAAVSGCDFIRVNVLTGVSATDQGMVEGCAAGLLRERDRLAPEIAIFADVLVKHAQSLSGSTIELAVEEALGRGLADGVIVTGETTGRTVDLDQLALAAETAKKWGAPVYVGSGTTASNIPDLKKIATGVIVGSALRKNGQAGEPLDSRRVKTLVDSFQGKRKIRKKKRK